VATKASSNSTRLLSIGALVLVVGVILVLLVLRGNVGTPAAAPADGDAEVTTAGQVEDGETTVTPTATVTPTTVEELASARLPLPASVPDGYEAVAVRVSFVRGLAAIPTPGDRVNLYKSGNAGDDPLAEDVDAELVLPDLEVLSLIGPLPTQNEGEITFLLAVEPADVPGLLPVAGKAELWFTLLPHVDAEDAA
jgi:hypothetical protein